MKQINNLVVVIKLVEQLIINLKCLFNQKCDPLKRISNSFLQKLL